MLQTAEVEAKTLPAPMRAYLLFEIASSYSEINPAKERSLRLQAFQSTLAIEGDDDNKEHLQDEILQDLLYNTKADLVKALPKAMPTLRNVYTAKLSGEYAKSNRFDRALELMRQVAADGQFPYQAAATLMLYLPEDRDSERQEIFNARSGRAQRTRPLLGDFKQPLRSNQSLFSISAMRCPACPSQRGGTVPCLGLPSRILVSSAHSVPPSCPTKMFVPTVTVTGRSVLLRKVRQGTFR